MSYGTRLFSFAWGTMDFSMVAMNDVLIMAWSALSKLIERCILTAHSPLSVVSKRD